MTGITGCTSETDRPQPTPSPLPGAATGTAPTLDARPVPMRVEVTQVSGRMSRAGRKSLERNVGRTIDRYFDDAHLGGSGDPFGVFSQGAARQARGDRDLLTNAGLDASRALVPRQKRARLSVLAPNEVAAGVTARVRLVYLVDSAEAVDQRVTVSGRLLLTRGRSGDWEIFGYDVARSARPAGKGASR